MDRWLGKVAIVTGASAGIGAAVATQLVEAGLLVAGFARRSEKIEKTSKELSGKKGKLHAVKVDMSDEDDILEGFKWVSDNLGPVSILVNNAGILEYTNITDGDTQKWKDTIDTNVMGLCMATREAVKIMKANRISGHIVHMNSVCGHKVLRVQNVNIYSASKHAITALTETLRQELNHLGLKIKISSISPGIVTTDIFDARECTKDAIVRKILKFAPALKPEDVADAVTYVLSTPPNVQVHELIIKPIGEAE